MILNDRLGLDDIRVDEVTFPKAKKSGFWAKTQILGGYGIHKSPTGVSILDETCFDSTNMVPISGVQYAFEKIFEIKGPLETETMYDQLGIGCPNKVVTDYPINTHPVPGATVSDRDRSLPHPYGHRVCLFGVGITGNAENTLIEPEVDYKEHSLTMSRSTSDGTILEGLMLPFRFTDSELTNAEKLKYFGKKLDDTTGNVAYFLKQFETEVEIKNFWNTGEDDDYVETVDNTVWKSDRTTPIDSFAEIVLKISKKDLKEWFEHTGNITKTRINTIGLFTGYYNAELGDYENVTLFSKLTIPVESLSLNKDLDIIYRVYGS